jgi:hypothetical protein
MPSPQYRYFIELQPRDGVTLPRSIEAESRRTAALGFLTTVRDWLKQQDLSEKVSALTVTLFGQIQITCEADVIKRIRHDDIVDIASIRQGTMFSENLGRWHEAR